MVKPKGCSSARNLLLQQPAAELHGLRVGEGLCTSSHGLVAGGQVEVLVRCPVPASAAAFPASGVLGVKTLQTENGSQAAGITVGYDFGGSSGSGSGGGGGSGGGVVGFASVPAVLGQWGNTSRTDQTPPLQTLLPGGGGDAAAEDAVGGGGSPVAVIELRVFVDGQLIETFFQGEASITTATGNMVGGDGLSSSFVNTANLRGCNVTSWALSL